MGTVETFFQFYFFHKILKRNIWFPGDILFIVCAVAIAYFIPVGSVIGFGIFVLLLTAGGILIYHSDVKSSLLYATLVTEIMLLCYGIVKHLSSVLYLLIPVNSRGLFGIVFMLLSELASLGLAWVCYYMVYRYFSYYTAAEMQQMFLVFIPILMIFIMSEYINTLSCICSTTGSCSSCSFLDF